MTHVRERPPPPPPPGLIFALFCPVREQAVDAIPQQCAACSQTRCSAHWWAQANMQLKEVVC